MVLKVKYCCNSVYLLKNVFQERKKERKSKVHAILNNDNKRKENMFHFFCFKCLVLFLLDKIYRESI